MADFERKRYRKAWLVWTAGWSPLAVRSAVALGPNVVDSVGTAAARAVGAVPDGAGSNRQFSCDERRLFPQRIACHHVPRPVEFSRAVPPWV